MLKKFWLEIKKLNIPHIIIVSVIGIGLVLTIFWGIGSMTKGYSSAETGSIGSSKSVTTVINKPINAPYHLAQFTIYSINHQNRTIIRAISAFVALVFLFCFFYILRYWFGSYIAALGMLLLAGTPFFLILARSATPAIMLFAPLVPVALFVWLQQTRQHIGPGLVILAAATGLCLYTPGTLWLVLLAIGLCYKQIVRVIGKAGNAWMITSIAIFVISITPLLLAIATSGAMAREALFLPQHWQSPAELAKTIFVLPASLAWQVRYASDFVVGRLPLLDFSVVVFALFGLYAMLVQAKQEAFVLLALILGGSAVAIINNSVVALGLVLPVFIVFSAAGLRYLYVEWQTVFPKNPIPHALAIGLMIAVVGQHFIFGLNYAHYAWPHTQRTKTVYVIK